MAEPRDGRKGTVLYTGVSTQEQALHCYSLEGQMQRLREHAAKFDVVIDTKVENSMEVIVLPDERKDFKRDRPADGQA